MDNYDLKNDGYDSEGTLSVLEYQGNKKPAMVKTGGQFNNLYVKNFSKHPNFTDDSLADLFKEFGEVQNACIMRDANGESKGFGFVCFHDPAAAEKATKTISEINTEAHEEGEDKSGGKDVSKFAKLFVGEVK